MSEPTKADNLVFVGICSEGTHVAEAFLGEPTNADKGRHFCFLSAGQMPTKADNDKYPPS
jgi:hypothetical protein